MMTYAITPDGLLTGTDYDPMSRAAGFMERWEQETGRAIGDAPGTDLTRLDECLAAYVSQCEADAVTGSLFEVGA